MNRIRTAVLAAALLLGLSATAQAQAQQGMPGGMGQGHGAGMGMQMMRGIELTDAQRERVRAIHQRHLAERDSLRARYGGAAPDSASVAAYRALTDRQHAEMRAILTPAQQQQFDRNVAKARDRMERRRGALGMEGRRRDGRRGGPARDSGATGKRQP